MGTGAGEGWIEYDTMGQLGNIIYPSDSSCPEKTRSAMPQAKNNYTRWDGCCIMNVIGKRVVFIRCTLCTPRGSQCCL